MLNNCWDFCPRICQDVWGDSPCPTHSTCQYLPLAPTHCMVAAPWSLTHCGFPARMKSSSTASIFFHLRNTCSNQVTATFCFSFSQPNSWRFLSLPFKSLYIIFAAHLRNGPTFKIWPQPDWGTEPYLAS